MAKQCRSRSVGFFRTQLIWIYTVCKGRVHPGSAGPGLTSPLSLWHRTASVAQSDARPTGDREFTGSSPPGPATLIRGDWSWDIFYGHSLPSTDSRRAVVSFWRKNVYKYWLAAQRTKPLQEKVCLNKLVALDMTQMGWLGRKISTQSINSWLRKKMTKYLR